MYYGKVKFCLFMLTNIALYIGRKLLLKYLENLYNIYIYIICIHICMHIHRNYSLRTIYEPESASC